MFLFSQTPEHVTKQDASGYNPTSHTHTNKAFHKLRNKSPIWYEKKNQKGQIWPDAERNHTAAVSTRLPLCHYQI